jgi:rSAM/selenodomain-associated transferase 1
MSRYRILSPFHPAPAFRGRCALAIMAKAPVPGKVKTRLSPPLTAGEAAELNACFLRDTVANLQAARALSPADWVISYTPTGAEAAFDDILPAGALLLPQRGDAFGERLLSTAEDLFACGFSAVCLIDSDSPTVPTSEFAQAAAELLRPGKRAVLGTSADGGYYLVGLQSAEANLFDRITWSTELVAAETLERAREIDLPVIMLREWYDVDDAVSLDRLQREWIGDDVSGGYPAPHTRQYLASMTGRLEAWLV